MDDKLREELSAAVALTTLGLPSIRTQTRPQVLPLNVIEMQHRINMNNRLILERSIAAAAATANVSRPALKSNAITPSTNNSRGLKRNFAQKLFDLLQTGLHADIIRWLPGGKAFIVVDKRRFANEILPNYFKESQYTSFTRKLSRWKFTRVSRGPYMGAYYHKNFRSDNRSLCKLMSCNNSKLNKKDDGKQGEDLALANVEEDENTINSSQKIAKNNSAVPSIKPTAAVEDSRKNAQPRHVASKSRPEFTNDANTSPSLDDFKNDMMSQVTSLENNMNNTNQNIVLIKKQLMEIRLRKAQVEEKKQFLIMQAAEARRLKEIQHLRNAVNLSIQQAESNIIVAATRALNRSNRCLNLGRTQHQQRALYQAGSLHQAPHNMISNVNSQTLKRMQLLNGNVIYQMRNNESRAKPSKSSRAFAA